MKRLVIKDVSMTFTVPGDAPIRALHEVSLELQPGEIMTILGPSGCGKTTLLNIVAGFLAPTKGEVRLEDNRITGPGEISTVTSVRPKSKPHDTRIMGPGADRGMVFQKGALFEWMTVEKNVSFGPDMAKKPRAETRQAVAHLLKTVGLQDFATKPVYQLSGGMQQRVALARCLANDPDVILMDEPLGALDALTREKMQGLILKLWKETRKTIILITHSVEEALFLGERLVVMAPRPGRIEKEYRLPFADRGMEDDPRHVKTSPDFTMYREEILSMIWSMEEEIMGRAKEPA